MRTTTKDWDRTTPGEHALNSKQRRINAACRPNRVSQKKRRLNIRRGGR